jgi:DNA-binding transcriptional ArsR family regulator
MRSNVGSPMPRARKASTNSGHDMTMMSTNARDASELLKALAHESRLSILCKLIDGEKHVSELEEALDMRQSAVSQQLARLRLEGLVTFRREGKQVYYSLANGDVRKVIGVLVGIFCK